MTPEITVAVVSFNTRDLLRECLESLEPDARSGRVEVWVVDNASEDGSPAMVLSEFEWVHLRASSSNLGFGRAINEVASLSETEWIVAANADIRVRSGALDALTSAGAAHPGSAILAPRLIGRDGNTQQSVHGFPGVGLALALASGVASTSDRIGDRLCIDGRWDPDREREVDWAHGAFLLCRRSAFDLIGGFDAEQWMYAEDLDLAWRARAAGWDVRYVPQAEVDHEGAASTSAAFGDEVGARFMTATFAWMVKRRGLISTYAYAAISLLGASARWLIYGFGASLDRKRFGARRDAARSWMALHREGLRGRSTLLSRR